MMVKLFRSVSSYIALTCLLILGCNSGDSNASLQENHLTFCLSSDFAIEVHAKKEQDEVYAKIVVISSGNKMEVRELVLPNNADISFVRISNYNAAGGCDIKFGRDESVNAPTIRIKDFQVVKPSKDESRKD